jgi:L-lactate dehydrogenase complex protein LldE
VDKTIDAIAATGAGTLLGGDLGCLMNLAGRIRRRGIDIRVRHAAEVLAGETDGPAIGEGS